MDVYVSMARAAKYNVDVASQNLNKKIFNQNPNLKPHDIIQNIMNTNVDDGNPLYDASRVLEYAIIYAEVKPECQPAVCGKQLLYEVFPAFGDGSHQITSGRLVCLPQG